ncbi:MAG: DUF1289 domain-containing protein [Acidobacteria bacterium]|nr:DUF1289 domain-containing protein [Acidobacteriota bacterium]
MKYLSWLAVCTAPLFAQEQIFSGPQPGEPLPPFKALAASGPDSGQEVDFIARYGDAPVLLVFLRDIDRNVYRTLWPCDRYAAGRPDLRVLYVYLAPDRVDGERSMRAVAKSLSLTVPVAVSLDGVEGPGAYGLNKQVAVTAIVAKGGKVLYNRTIVQPGASEAQKIIAECVKLVGGRVPSDLWLARGPSRTLWLTQEKLEETLQPDPPQLAEAFARMTPPHATGIAAKRTTQEIRAWAAASGERKQYVVRRIPAVLEICESDEARQLLNTLREELAR